MHVTGLEGCLAGMGADEEEGRGADEEGGRGEGDGQGGRERRG